VVDVGFSKTSMYARRTVLPPPGVVGTLVLAGGVCGWGAAVQHGWLDIL
jgi:hypothetical protein